MTDHTLTPEQVAAQIHRMINAATFGWPNAEEPQKVHDYIEALREQLRDAEAMCQIEAAGRIDYSELLGVISAELADVHQVASFDEMPDLVQEICKQNRRLTAALRNTPLVKCAEFMELVGMGGVAYDPTELKEAAAALRALAEMGVSDG